MPYSPRTPMSTPDDPFWYRHRRGLVLAAVTVAGFLILYVLVTSVFLRKTDIGYSGIILTYGQEGQPHTQAVPPGSYAFINPFTSTFIEYPVAQQALVLASNGSEGELQGNSTIGCTMNGGGTLNFGVTLQWQVDPAHPEVLYLKKPGVPLTSSLNDDIATTIVYGAVRSDLIDSCGSYTWQDIEGDGTGANRRDIFRQEVRTQLRNTLAEDGILVNDLLFNEITPDKQISDIIAARNQATQSQYAKIQAQNQADAQQITATGNANAEIIKAKGDAQAIALVNGALAKSPNYIAFLNAQSYQQLIARWDGHLPQQEVGGNNPLIQALGGGK